MTTPDPPFGFSAPRFALGVVMLGRVAQLRAAWAWGDDRGPEHYRWRACTEVVAERRPLAPELAAAPYPLGAGDADRPMGEATIHWVAALPECPAEVGGEAAASGVQHVIRAARRYRAVV